MQPITVAAVEIPAFEPCAAKARVEGTVLVISARLSVNLNAQTMEQVVAKRRKLLADMAEGVEIELRNGIADTHPGTRCALSQMEPIRGVRYQHAWKDVSICEAEYRQLPTGDYAQNDFVGPVAPPISIYSLSVYTL